MFRTTVQATHAGGRADEEGGEEPGPPLVVAEELVVGYEQPVLGPVSFRVHPGEVVGLWGPNGAGKSTLLKAVSGTARVFRGRLEVAENLRIAYQTQQPLRLGEMPLKGRELLRCMGADKTEPPGRLGPLLEKRIDRLSGGQFQILNIWACLGGEADLVLLDEPSNNLDQESLDLLVELLEARRSEEALLLVSHETSFLDRAATRRLEVGT
ncbi:ATP-binding cassette domain-containing protein [Thiohalorhabdus methylotrophus]|uniref:ATP-binding cassette domain-containing protein n=1 Tax=Thiohalorhabdus methylotrophus TaxID=3242694 RepID=A0ABV4TSC3_9GAMM